MTQRDHWHAFDGWACAHAIDIFALPPARFLDLVHHYVLLITDPDEHAKLNRMLVGAPTHTIEVDERAGFTPPSWWKGDEYASRSGDAARLTLKRRR